MATLHDGISARAIPALVSPHGERLVVRSDGDASGVAMGLLRRGALLPSGMTLHRVDRPDWGLVLHHVSAGSWPFHLPRVGRLSAGALALYAGVAATLAGMAATGWFQGGEIVAAMAPYGVTAPIGRRYVLQMGRACAAPAGVAALQRLAARLAPPQGFAEPLTLTVVDNPGVNAFALPGGHVAITGQLIEAAASPDELAGVLAHELAHVERQHPDQALIRAMGLSLLVRSLGGDVGRIADLALLLHSSRAAEAEADAGAIALLRGAHVATAAMAGFLDRQGRVKGVVAGAAAGALPRAAARLGDYASTHPADSTRAARFCSAAGSNASPAMPDGDWQALRSICG